MHAGGVKPYNCPFGGMLTTEFLSEGGWRLSPPPTLTNKSKPKKHNSMTHMLPRSQRSACLPPHSPRSPNTPMCNARVTGTALSPSKEPAHRFLPAPNGHPRPPTYVSPSLVSQRRGCGSTRMAAVGPVPKETLSSTFDHTTRTPPDPVRSPKLKRVGPG